MRCSQATLGAVLTPEFVEEFIDKYIKCRTEEMKMEYENWEINEMATQFKISAGLIMRQYETCLEKFRAGDYKWAMLSPDLQTEVGCEAFLRGLIWCKMVISIKKKNPMQNVECKMQNAEEEVKNYEFKPFDKEEKSPEPPFAKGERADLVEMVGKAVLAIEN